MSLHIPSVTDLENRPYQDAIIDTIFRAFVSHLEHSGLLTKESVSKKRISELEAHVKNVARMKDTSKKDTSHLVDQSALIDQAMGSGKTIVLARILDRIMRFRDRYMSDQSLRVLVVTDRISTVD